MNWQAYFSDVAAFAGVVFAIVLAARQLTEHAQRKETRAQNQARLWDSLSVTYELAAAALFGILYGIRGSGVDIGLATLVVIIGIWLYIRYLASYYKLPATMRRGMTRTAAWMTILPMGALLTAALSYVWWYVPEPVANYMLAASVAWLVFSGTSQTLVWYYNAWGGPTEPSSDD